MHLGVGGQGGIMECNNKGAKSARTPFWVSAESRVGGLKTRDNEPTDTRATGQQPC